MRSQFTTSRMLAAFVCAAGLGYAGQAYSQDQAGDAGVAEEVDLFDEGADNGEGAVEQGDTGTFDIHVKDLQITQVLQLLSIQAERNIVASRDVSGTVSADLFNVDFTEALDMVLLPNGFRWVEEGNFIKVITEEDWQAEQDANRVIVTRVHRLSYLRADETAQFVEPMLSDAGTITASGNVEDGFEAGLDDGGADTYAGTPTLVIRDYEDKVEEILATIALLDTKPKQVIIECTVMSASLTEANAFGVDFALFTDLGALASPLNVVDDLITGGLGGGTVNPSGNNQVFGGQSTVGGTAAPNADGIKLGVAAGDAAVFIRALDSVTDTTLIASPKITVLDRQRGNILVGEEIAYLSSTTTETSTTETVEFLEVGTQLSVRPFVAEDGSIRLELRPSVSDATIRNIGTTTAPDTETVELVTNIIVDSGQTVVLGGLFVDDSTIDRSQVPGLGDVPLLGAAFQGQDDNVSRSEVIFLVKATVVESETLIQMGDQARAEVDIAGVAQRERLLPWSKSKLTSQHMINAHQLYDQAMAQPAGAERDDLLAQSLYCVDMALHLDASMVDALILKQSITGEQIYIYHDSIVDRTFDSVLDEEMQSLGLPELPMGDTRFDAPVIPSEEVFSEEAEEAEGEAAQLPEAEEAEEIAGVDTDAQWLDELVDEAFEGETAETADAATNSDEAESPRGTFMGFTWRSLSTAQLLELAANAGETEEAETEVEADETVVEVETEDAFDWDTFDEE